MASVLCQLPLIVSGFYCWILGEIPSLVCSCGVQWLLGLEMMTNDRGRPPKEIGINCLRLVKRKLPRNMTEHQISWQFFRCCMGWNKMVTDIYVVIDNIQQALKNTGSNTQNRFSIWWYTHNYTHTTIYILLIMYIYIHIHYLAVHPYNIYNYIYLLCNIYIYYILYIYVCV